MFRKNADSQGWSWTLMLSDLKLDPWRLEYRLQAGASAAEPPVGLETASSPL
jgi:hypothetical protein